MFGPPIGPILDDRDILAEDFRPGPFSIPFIQTCNSSMASKQQSSTCLIFLTNKKTRLVETYFHGFGKVVFKNCI